jgi:predicted transposase/invertase (TIGR01784 family)
MKNTKPKFINLLTDFAFKRIFGNEEHKDLLIHFLNEVLHPEGKKIKDLQFKNTEQTIDKKEDKKVIFDFFCEDELGDKFIVEIQRQKSKFFKERMLYYGSKVISSQGRKGTWNYRLNPVYIIGIMDFSYTEDTIIDYYSLIGKHSQRLHSDCLKMITIELGNFNKSELELVSNMDKWLYMLKNLYKLDKIPESFKEHIYMKILNLAEYAALSKPEQTAYDRSLKIMRDNHSAMEYQKELGLEEGLKIGREEGRVEGRVEGREEGKRVERKATIQLLYKNGLSVEKIKEFTGFDYSEIKEALEGV